ncbi:MAG: DUF1566 domain-containing protein [Spirochaetes bacterium]|nr:DUF1566 domain-containing protein [Spirochaetota bacterium]
MIQLKSITTLLILLALLMAPACDTLEEIELSEEAAPVYVKPEYTVDNDNLVVTDITKNGIMWQKCAYGETGADCSGDNALQIAYNYDVDNSAVEYCNSSITGGYTDWRLPTLAELDTLAYTDVAYDWFRNYSTLKGQYWWSSTMENVNFVYAFKLYPKDKVYSAIGGSIPRYLRCARSIQP